MGSRRIFITPATPIIVSMTKGCLKAMAFVLAVSSSSYALEPGEAYKADMGPDGVQRAEVEGGSYYFKPGRIIVKKGVPTEITIWSTSLIVPHSFVLKVPGSGVDIEVALALEPKKVSIPPLKEGVYGFYCGNRLLFFKSHREKGMEGSIEVVP